MSDADRARRYRARHGDRHNATCRRWRARNRLAVTQYRALKYARDRVQETRDQAEELHA